MDGFPPAFRMFGLIAAKDPLKRMIKILSNLKLPSLHEAILEAFLASAAMRDSSH